MLLLCFHLALAGKAQTPTAANQVKAVFLFNFTNFVSWPPAALPGNTSPFVIGILGKNPFGNFLERVVEGEKVGSHPIRVQYFSEPDEVRNCHILFVNRESPASVIADLHEKAILTVSDAENFAKGKGIIGFFQENNKIKLQINTKNARSASLQISSKLLRLAQVIEN